MVFVLGNNPKAPHFGAVSYAQRFIKSPYPQICYRQALRSDQIGLVETVVYLGK